MSYYEETENELSSTGQIAETAYPDIISKQGFIVHPKFLDLAHVSHS